MEAGWLLLEYYSSKMMKILNFISGGCDQHTYIYIL